MGSRSSAFPVFLVLAFTHVVAATDLTAEAPGYRHDEPPLAPAAGGGAIPRAAADCVKTVMETSQPCARDVLLTIVFGFVHLSQGCCNVLAGVGEKCVADVFSAVPQPGPALLPVVNRICGFVATVL
ncbi:hypothetical protein QOZ80_8BG0664570 [Eleusine coracana subsp. coracana]|nr:hypothetical protein QOZ80_8BG0664570 [Eleusine coracana subsp. coracana]